ncbi:MAG: DUF2804 domain-containing protein [Spirochaetaceae bacterium]|jgi:hypothetical protein|nr:DUF2804 domain-containing protein [Spirochaetaceae bacterium]
MGLETTENRKIMDGSGKPVTFGWARKPLFEYNPPILNGIPKTRITEADRYIIFSATHLIVFEVMDGGTLGHVGISIISVKDHRRSTHSIDSFLSLGRFELPRSSDKGSIRIREKKSTLDFILMESGARIIKVDYPRFGNHRHLRGEVVLSAPPNAQSIVTVSPWRREKYAFRYFRCSPWFITEGVMQFGTAEIYFTRDNAWGIYDWKREVRPRRDIRYWAAACGMADGRLVGFNVGYGSTDSSAGTENAFFLDGVIHKLDQVTFHIPPTDWLEEWKFTSNDRRLEMTFTPNQARKEHRSIFLHSVKCRQVCGTFSGKVVLDDGSSLGFWNITGFAERRKTRL